jgi:hypothetical protein
MQCPSCKSDHVQKLRLIYESGTSDTYGTSYGSTIGYSSGGGLYTGSTRTEISETKKTRAAQKASPPEKETYRLALVAFFFSWWLMAISWPWDLPDLWYGRASRWTYLGLALFIAACWMVQKAYRYNKKVWPGEYDTWKRSWHCNKCGHIYVN